MKLLLEYKFDKDLIERLQYLNHLKVSYEYILETIIYKKSKYEFNENLLDYYMNKFSSINLEFSILTTEMVESIDPKFMDNNKYYTEFVFKENSARIYALEEGECAPLNYELNINRGRRSTGL